ncbi:MAG: spore cortex biosynthesis protein YabQ [Acutalibacteraceae bacterium]
MYTVEQSEQTLIFIASLGIGFLLGILYDLFRALRLSFTKGKAAIVIFDLLYFFAVAFFSYMFILASNKGEVRSYIIIGELLGAVFYYFSLGIAVIKITDNLVKVLKRFYGLLFKIISFPFRFLNRVFSKIFGKMKLFFKKSEKNSKKMQKKVLPKVRVYVYNLFDILCAGSHKARKGGKVGGGTEKEKPTQTS